MDCCCVFWGFFCVFVCIFQEKSDLIVYEGWSYSSDDTFAQTCCKCCIYQFQFGLIREQEEEIDTEVLTIWRWTWSDIYDKVSEELEKSGDTDCECIGGGRVIHDPQAKKIHKLKTRYPDYEVTWDNEGY
uniref:Uncharacterized protein n=1 Tax=Amphiprion ocellaris TaxID=80972 RepID=A0A3Q1C5T0_AMPOC